MTTSEVKSIVGDYQEGEIGGCFEITGAVIADGYVKTKTFPAICGYFSDDSLKVWPINDDADVQYVRYDDIKYLRPLTRAEIPESIASRTVCGKRIFNGEPVIVTGVAEGHVTTKDYCGQVAFHDDQDRFLLLLGNGNDWVTFSTSKVKSIMVDVSDRQKQIRDIIAVLTDYWLSHPYLRLGQIIVNAAPRTSPCPSVFYASDKDIVKSLKREIGWDESKGDDL